MDQKEVTFTSTVADTFPYIESTIRVLDDNLAWWKVNGEKLEEEISQAIQDNANIQDPEVDVKFILYDGPDQKASDVELNTPAIRFYFPELTDEEVQKIHQQIGDTWNGRKVYQEVNSLIFIFE